MTIHQNIFDQQVLSGILVFQSRNILTKKSLLKCRPTAVDLYTMAVVVEYIVLSLVILILLFIKKGIDKHNTLIHDIANRSVLVTGCDTGFGNLLAKSLDARGVRVFAGCLTSEGAKGLKEKTSSRLETLEVDVTNEESVTNALKYVESSLNGEGIHYYYTMSYLYN